MNDNPANDYPANGNTAIERTCELTLSAETLRVHGWIDFDTVVNAEPLGRQWLTTQAPQQCYIDLGGVQYSNSAGITLLLSWLRAAADTRKSVTLVRIPDDLLSIIRLGGLEDVLHLDIVTCPLVDSGQQADTIKK